MRRERARALAQLKARVRDVALPRVELHRASDRAMGSSSFPAVGLAITWRGVPTGAAGNPLPRHAVSPPRREPATPEPAALTIRARTARRHPRAAPRPLDVPMLTQRRLMIRDRRHPLPAVHARRLVRQQHSARPFVSVAVGGLRHHLHGTDERKRADGLNRAHVRNQVAVMLHAPSAVISTNDGPGSRTVPL